MKNFKLIALTGLLSLSSFAFGRTLDVRVVPASNPKDISIRFTTVERHSSMCHMTNTKLEMELPPVGFGVAAVVSEGAITIQAQVTPRTMCMMAFGPNSGGLTLNRGVGLPALSNGNYRLTINGEAYGTLVVRGDSVKLVD